MKIHPNSLRIASFCTKDFFFENNAVFRASTQLSDNQYSNSFCNLIVYIF